MAGWLAGKTRRHGWTGAVTFTPYGTPSVGRRIPTRETATHPTALLPQIATAVIAASRAMKQHQPGMQGGCVNGSQWPGPCTALGGHAYSIDGRQWYISPVAPFNATTLFEDGSVVMWRARERPHVILNAKGAILVVYEYTIDTIVDRSTVQCGIHRQIDAITTAAYGNFNLTSQ